MGRGEEEQVRGWKGLGTPVVLLLLCAAAQLLFVINIDRPAKLYFDEVHYVPAARALIDFVRLGNPEHPPLAKLLIGIGIELFGDGPVGWRLFSSVAAAVTVAGIFFIAHAVFRDVRVSAATALFAMLNQLLFVQARIAMLDVYMSAFLLPAVALVIEAHRGGRVRLKLAAAGLLFGLGIGCKWAATPYLVAAGLLFLILKLRRPTDWPGASLIGGAALLGATATLAYLGSFAPLLLLSEQPLALSALMSHQLEMYRLQTQPLAPHTYQSDWWDWPLIGRPMWYLYEPVFGIMRGVLFVGNPAIMWGGLIGVALCLVAGLRRRDPRLLTAAGLYLFSFGMWIVIPKKIGFYYYYFLPSLFLCVPLAAALVRFGAGRLRWLMPAFTLVAAGLFAYFYPIISAAALPDGQAFQRWTWFESWK